MGHTPVATIHQILLKEMNVVKTKQSSNQQINNCSILGKATTYVYYVQRVVVLETMEPVQRVKHCMISVSVQSKVQLLRFQVINLEVRLHVDTFSAQVRKIKILSLVSMLRPMVKSARTLI